MFSSARCQRLNIARRNHQNFLIKVFPIEAGLVARKHSKTLSKGRGTAHGWGGITGRKGLT
jgi:hypothetical protein